MTDAVISPENVLPDGADHAELGGVVVRKGSVAAFVANARNLEELEHDSAAYRATVAEMERLVPVLRAVGLFDVFEPKSEPVRRIVRAADGMISPGMPN